MESLQKLIWHCKSIILQQNKRRKRMSMRRPRGGTGSRSRWWSMEILSSPLPTNTSKLQHLSLQMTWRTAEQIFKTKDIKKRPHQDRWEGQRHGLFRTHTPVVAIHKQKGYHNHGGPPWGMRGPSLMSGSPTWGTCTRKMSPHNVWLWKPVGLTSRRARGLWETETALLKDSCTNSLILSPNAEAAAEPYKHLGHARKFTD